jgi:hypothetical protein
MSFWKQVRQGVSSAASEAERQATIGRLSLEVNGIKGNVRKKHEELGEIALKLVRAGELSHPELATVIEEISQLEKQASDVEAHLAEVRTGTSASS